MSKKLWWEKSDVWFLFSCLESWEWRPTSTLSRSFALLQLHSWALWNSPFSINMIFLSRNFFLPHRIYLILNRGMSAITISPASTFLVGNHLFFIFFISITLVGIIISQGRDMKISTRMSFLLFFYLPREYHRLPLIFKSCEPDCLWPTYISQFVVRYLLIIVSVFYNFPLKWASHYVGLHTCIALCATATPLSDTWRHKKPPSHTYWWSQIIFRTMQGLRRGPYHAGNHESIKIPAARPKPSSFATLVTLFYWHSETKWVVQLRRSLKKFFKSQMSKYIFLPPAGSTGPVFQTDKNCCVSQILLSYPRACSTRI